LCSKHNALPCCESFTYPILKAGLREAFLTVSMHFLTYCLYPCSICTTLTFSFDSLTGGSIVGDMAPYQAFAIGGLGSVRGYGEGAVGSGRSCLVANNELTFPLVTNGFIYH